MSQRSKTLDEIKRATNLPVVVVNQLGLVTFVNNSFEKVFGWQANEIIGKFVTKIIPERLHDAHNLGFSSFITTGMPTLLNKTLVLSAIKKDGAELEAEHYIVAEKQGEEWVFAATIRPVGEEEGQR